MSGDRSYRPWSEVRRPSSRRRRLLARLRLKVWIWRYWIARKIYPFYPFGDVDE